MTQSLWLPSLCFLALSMLTAPVSAEHPLDEAIKIAEGGHDRIRDDIKDYRAILVKQELIGDKLMDEEYMRIKVRQEQKKNGKVVVPFSVYLKFVKPKKVKGREVIYVEGRNGGKMFAHESPESITNSLVGTVKLDPTGFIAMQGNRYPITEIGIENLTKRLIEVAKRDRKLGECTVNYRSNAKINKRSCSVIEVIHPENTDGKYKFHKAMVYIDDELQVPVRFESYDWPDKPGGEPKLMEAYTYVDIELNVGLTDKDFDTKNPAYGF